MTEYNSRIEVDKFEMLSGEKASLLRKAFDKPMNPSSIMYPGNFDNTVVFSSTSAKDLIDAMQNGFWDHTKKAHQVEAGTTIYVFTNVTESNKIGSCLAIKGTAQRVMYKLSNPSSTTWTSSTMQDADVLLDKAIEVEDKAA